MMIAIIPIIYSFIFFFLILYTPCPPAEAQHQHAILSYCSNVVCGWSALRSLLIISLKFGGIGVEKRIALRVTG